MGLLHRLWTQWSSKTEDDINIDTVETGSINIIPHVIAGERRVVESGDLYPVYNPCNGQVEKYFYAVTEEQIQYAIDVAKEAQQQWHKTEISLRLEILNSLGNMLEASNKDITAILIRELGITFQSAQLEIKAAINILNSIFQWKPLLRGEVIVMSAEKIEQMKIPDAIGVLLAIENNQLPLSSLIWSLSGALICGNALIYLPDTHHPSVTIFISEILEKLGIPKGLFNVLLTDEHSLEQIAQKSDIQYAIFMGKDSLLPLWHKKALPAMNRVSVVECRSIAVVFADANLQKTAQQLASAFVLGSQNGQSLSAVIVVNNSDKLFSQLLQQEINQIIETNNGSSKYDIPYGILPTESDWLACNNILVKLKEEGVEWLIEGGNQENQKWAWCTGLSLLDFVTADSCILKQNVNLPILPVIRVADWFAAQSILNDYPSINTLAVFSDNIKYMRQIIQYLSIDSIGINSIPQEAVAQKGLLGLDAKNALSIFTKIKIITNRWD